ncbi:IS1634 family transposase [Eisenbergiella porci]|uniref:IS1634 family transposase n=1 Tax=Eisenbergiella porci TaxID=2652274 RepID=UPI002A811C71|nr:transposase [Eisenbergiella porci]
MYAGQIEAVKLPDTGKTHILGNGYVYWYNEARWDNDRKMTVDNRVAIGKLDPDHPGMMFPNKRYFSLFKDAPIKESPSALPEDILQAPGCFSRNLNYGPYLAMMYAADHAGALKTLKQVFPKIWRKILAVAIHSADAENSVAQDFPYWCFQNYCGLSKPLTSGEISILYEEIAADTQSIPNFMYYFKDEYHKAFPENGETVLAFDSTNQNTYSKNNPKAEYGHPKVNEKLPDINTALFVDETTGIPLYYEHFYGSLLDKSETPYTVEKAQDLGFRKFFLMMDRGYFSQAVLCSMEGLSFGIMCPDNLLIVRQMIHDYGEAIRDHEDYYIAQEDVYGIHRANVPLSGGCYDVYLFYDSRRAEDERGTVHQKVKTLIQMAESRKHFSKKMQGQFSPWLVIEPSEKDPGSGRCFSVKENRKSVQDCLDEAGFFVIVSNAGLDAEQMIRIARMRDQGEKAFHRMKSHFGLAKTYVHNAVTYEGKMFVAFFSLIMVEAYRHYVKEVLTATASETTATTIGELRKYQIHQKRDGSWMPAYAMTKKQKQIFRKLQLTEKEVEKTARELKLRV